MNKSTMDFSVENSPTVTEYHTWKPSYNNIRYRTMSQKPMFKDPYRQIRPIYAQAREIFVTNDECFPTLIPATAVKIEQPAIYQAPRKTGSLAKRFVLSIFRGNFLFFSFFQFQKLFVTLVKVKRCHRKCLIDELWVQIRSAWRNKNL